MINKNFDLVSENTFRVSAIASEYFCYKTIDDLHKYFSANTIDEFFILGGGSNVLLSEDKIDRKVIKSDNKTIEKISENKDYILIKAYAGLEWDEFVKECNNNNWIGLSSLSLIPGTVGAAPVQNIGAYGSEACEYVHEVECYDAVEKQKLVLKNSECLFSYRDSVFKERKELIVISVTFKLYHSEVSHRSAIAGESISVAALFVSFFNIFRLTYKSIRIGKATGWKLRMNFDYVREFLTQPLISSSLKRKIVVFIRKRSMPDPKKVANVGCFFKSPIVTKDELKQLSLEPNINVYPYTDNKVKISAGDLIRCSGLDGARVGNVGIDKNRPLILINYGNATGKEIYDFSLYISDTVYKEKNIRIEPEVVIV